jgi:hypothetical protein
MTSDGPAFAASFVIHMEGSWWINFLCSLEILFV